ncbi:hypothetical protein [Fusobacterium varium]|uniref:hypothetical protein n=1 Tax=Fusobacterium varium TaxID=856 RepID=UPI003562E26A
MGSLRDRLGYNRDKITIWEETEGTKDEDGIPIKIWQKTVLQGTWENSIKTIRNAKGDGISSVGNALVPSLLDIRKNILIEQGEAEGEKPSPTAKKIITMEEITRIRKPACEWIYYV